MSRSLLLIITFLVLAGCSLVGLEVLALGEAQHLRDHVRRDRLDLVVVAQHAVVVELAGVGDAKNQTVGPVLDRIRQHGDFSFASEVAFAVGDRLIDAFNAVSPRPPLVAGEQILLGGETFYVDNKKAVRELELPQTPFRQAAAAPESQSLLLIGTVVMLPLVLAYTAFCYYIFRGKTSHEATY